MNTFSNHANSYIERLHSSFTTEILACAQELAEDLFHLWKSQKRLFIIGNGGSAANAIHIANDFTYGVACGIEDTQAFNVEALTSNPAVVTCLSNDIGYENIFSHQLRLKGSPGDLLLCLSGSGNSTNIINAINAAKALDVNTYSILGYDGGACKAISDKYLHVQVSDMQVAEDIQVIVLHICCQYIRSKLASLSL